MMSAPFFTSREVYVPQLENGLLHYTIMEIVAASNVDSGWAVKDIPTHPFPTATGPSAVISTMAEGINTHMLSEGGLQVQ
jgi:hypothetical protein